MPTPPEIVESLRNNPDPDAKVLFHSAQVGSGLTKLHRPDFVFYFPNDTAAKAVEWKLSKDDFEVAIEPPDEIMKDTWSLRILASFPRLKR